MHVHMRAHTHSARAHNTHTQHNTHNTHTQHTTQHAQHTIHTHNHNIIVFLQRTVVVMVFNTMLLWDMTSLEQNKLVTMYSNATTE